MLISEDPWFEIYKFQFEDYQHTLDLAKLIHLILHAVKEVDGFFFDSHYFILFRF